MTPWVRWLLMANAVVFFLTQMQPSVGVTLAFFPPGVLSRPWTPFTYMFVHASFWHLFFNMLSLFFFGPRVEERLGKGRFISLYLVSGLTGALLSFLTPAALIVGASGAVFGVQLAFARYWPRVRILIWGILPIEARWLIVIMTIVSLQGGFRGGGGIAHWAHLGGYVGAAVFLIVMERTSPARSFRSRAIGATAPPVSARVLGDRASMERWSRIRAEDLHEVNRTELERIRHRLEKEGAGSLTASDREFLDRFSGRVSGEPR
jgi:membrane associated rhomboid family serine protease